MDLLYTIGLVVAAAGAGGAVAEDGGTGVAVGVASGVAIVLARVIQHLWPAPSDRQAPHMAEAITTLAVKIDKTNELLNKVVLRVEAQNEAIGEQRTDFRRVESAMASHMLREETTLRSVNTAIASVDKTVALVALHLKGPA